jgi:hypothetical protein
VPHSGRVDEADTGCSITISRLVVAGQALLETGRREVVHLSFELDEVAAREHCRVDEEVVRRHG